MFRVVGETHAHDYFEVILFYNSKEYNILRHVIAPYIRHIGNQKLKDNLLCYFKCTFK